MANCKNCGAALPGGMLVCAYCGTRQDVDLKGLHKYTVTAPESERICPRCNKPMQTIDLKIEGKFLVERCQLCMGMFFDPGELEALLDKSVSNVYHIDYNQIEAIRNAKRHDEFPVTYIKCPICQKLMNRINFGTQSGVIVDTCKGHGMWLDGGELRQLMEWMKAGGKLHHQQKELEYNKIQKQEEETKQRREAAESVAMEDGGKFAMKGTGYSSRGFNYSDPDDLLSSLSRFVGKLFG